MSRNKEVDTSWSDPQYRAQVGVLRPIVPTDPLEDVIEKTLEYPGVTLLDSVALAKYLAKEIRTWKKNGGELFERMDRIKEKMGSRQIDNIKNSLDSRPRKNYIKGEYKVNLQGD